MKTAHSPCGCRLNREIKQLEPLLNVQKHVLMFRIPDYDAEIIFKNVAVVGSAHQHCSLGLQYEDLVLDTTFCKASSEGSRRQYGRSTHWYIPSTVFLELGPLSTAQTGCRKATSGVINCSIALLCRSGEDVEVSNRITPRISSPGFSMNILPLTGQNVSARRLELQNSCQTPGLCSTKQRAHYCWLALMMLDAGTIACYCTLGDEQEEQMTRPSQNPRISGWTEQVFVPGFFRLLTSSGPGHECRVRDNRQNSPTHVEASPQASPFDDSRGTKIPPQPCFWNNWPKTVYFIIMSDVNCRFSEQHRE